jgi:hypothetical protein
MKDARWIDRLVALSDAIGAVFAAMSADAVMG